MKTILIAMSGAADKPSDALGEKTPFEVAKIPNLHFFAKTGKLGQVRLHSSHWESYPDVTLLSLLGFDPDKAYTGRGPLEAANMELKLEADEIPFRMNFITEANGKLADPTGGGLTSKEAKAFINFLNKKVASDFVRFFAGSQYRHIVVIKDAHGFDSLSAKTYCPHDIAGEKIEDYLPKGPGGELMKKLMFDAKLLLQDHEINQVRVDLNENPANMIWIWGQGKKPQLEKFQSRYDCQGTMISDAEYAKGIARLSGLTVADVRLGSGDLAENYEEKGKVLLEELEAKDFVCLHLKECDDASRNGDFRAKVSALESADFFILSKVKAYLEAKKDVRILFSPGYVMPWRTRKRTKDAVPFVLAGKNIMADDTEKFNENAAKATELKFEKGSDLVNYLFRNN